MLICFSLFRFSLLLLQCLKMLLLGGKSMCFSQKCWMNFRPPCPSPIWCITTQAMPEVIGMWVCVVVSLWPTQTMADNVLHDLDLNNWRNHKSVSNNSLVRTVSRLLSTSKRFIVEEILHCTLTFSPQWHHPFSKSLKPETGERVNDYVWG